MQQPTKDDVEIVNGYEIRYTPFWSEWQVSHPEIGVWESFSTLEEAVDYTERGVVVPTNIDRG